MIRWLSKAYWLQGLIAKITRLIPAVGVHNLEKYWALKKAFYMTSLDGVEGDYLEFGVFTGSSITAAMELSRDVLVPRKEPIRFYGFDSFEGFGTLQASDKPHPFFQDLNFKTDLKEVERRLQSSIKDNTRFKLIPGFYDATLKGHKPKDYGIERAGVVMVDCDTFSASQHVFEFISSALQEGTILLLDDFYCYRGNRQLGVYGAFEQFRQANPQWIFRRVFDFGFGGTSWMVTQ